MLPNIDLLAEILACPDCGADIVFDAAFRCSRPECLRHACAFPVVGSQPVLVSSSTHTISDPAEIASREGKSHIERERPRLTQLLRREILDGRATRHSRRLIALLSDLASRANSRPRILIVGGGEVGMGTEGLFADPHVELISFDIYASAATNMLADAHNIPLKDNSVDGVIIQYVLEHVVEPKQVASEIRRVLKPSGLLYAATPFLQPVHEGPYDFSRFSHSGHRWLFRGFTELDSGIAMGPGSHLIAVLDYWVRGVTRSRKAGKIAKLAFFWLQYLDLLLPSAYAIDFASALYFLGRKSAVEIAAPHLTSYYRGADRRTH